MSESLIGVDVVVDDFGKKSKAFVGLFVDETQAKRICAIIAERMVPDVGKFELQTYILARVDRDGVPVYEPDKTRKPLEYNVNA